MRPFKRKSQPASIPVAIVPPVDLNKPVENPALVAALAAHTDASAEATGRELVAQLNKANYLVAILTDEMTTTSGATAGNVTIEGGSRIKVLSCTDAQGNNLLALFTDWAQIGQWTTEPVSTLVMPSEEAWAFVLQPGQYQGAVLNPAGHSLPFSLSKIQQLQSAL